MIFVGDPHTHRSRPLVHGRYLQLRCEHVKGKSRHISEVLNLRWCWQLAAECVWWVIHELPRPASNSTNHHRINQLWLISCNKVRVHGSSWELEYIAWYSWINGVICWFHLQQLQLDNCHWAAGWIPNRPRLGGSGYRFIGKFDA